MKRLILWVPLGYYRSMMIALMVFLMPGSGKASRGFEDYRTTQARQSNDYRRDSHQTQQDFKRDNQQTLQNHQQTLRQDNNNFKQGRGMRN